MLVTRIVCMSISNVQYVAMNPFIYCQLLPVKHQRLHYWYLESQLLCVLNDYITYTMTQTVYSICDLCFCDSSSQESRCCIGPNWSRELAPITIPQSGSFKVIGRSSAVFSVKTGERVERFIPFSSAAEEQWRLQTLLCISHVCLWRVGVSFALCLLDACKARALQDTGKSKDLCICFVSSLFSSLDTFGTIVSAFRVGRYWGKRDFVMPLQRWCSNNVFLVQANSGTEAKSGVYLL